MTSAWALEHVNEWLRIGHVGDRPAVELDVFAVELPDRAAQLPVVFQRQVSRDGKWFTGGCMQSVRIPQPYGSSPLTLRWPAAL